MPCKTFSDTGMSRLHKWLLYLPLQHHHNSLYIKHPEYWCNGPPMHIAEQMIMVLTCGIWTFPSPNSCWYRTFYVGKIREMVASFIRLDTALNQSHAMFRNSLIGSQTFVLSTWSHTITQRQARIYNGKRTVDD